MDILQQYDDNIQDAALHGILAPSDATLPPHSDERLKRAADLAALPTRLGGFGLTRLTDKAGPAFLAGLLATAEEPGLTPNRLHLIDHAAAAHENTLQLLNLDHGFSEMHKLSTVLPPTPDDLIGDFAIDFSQNHSKLMPQAILMSHKAWVDRGVLTRAIRLHSMRSQKPTASNADVCHLLNITSKSQASRIMQGKLYLKNNIMKPADFVYWGRQHLGLPPPIATDVELEQTDCDVPAAPCKTNHAAGTKLNDHAGQHAVACVNANNPRLKTHTGLLRVLRQFGLEAGCEVSCNNPPTHTLLEHAYSEEECTSLFPKDVAPNEAVTKVFQDLDTDIRAYRGARTISGRTSIANRLDASLRSAPGKPADTQGRTIDLEIVPPQGNPLWIDVCSVHHNTKTIQGK